MWAQTDVTSTYITNAGFESASFKEGSFNDRKDNLTGWTVTKINDGTRFALGTERESDGHMGYVGSSALPTEGNNYLSLRGRWHSNSSNEGGSVAQTISSLPKGQYTLTADYQVYINASGKGSATFTLETNGGSYLNTQTGTVGVTASASTTNWNSNDWKQVSFTFDYMTGETTFKLAMASTANTQVLLDNVKLCYNSNYTDALSSAIACATAMNSRKSSSDLTTAIATAQDVLNNKTDNIDYQETIDNAVTALNEAISTAWSSLKGELASGEDITYLVENSGFEYSTPVSSGVVTTIADAKGNNTPFGMMQFVSGWTFVGENGNNHASGIYAYGETPWLGGTDYVVPATNPDGVDSGQALGIVAVWTATTQYKQNVTLPAGRYTITLPIYNKKGGTTNFSKNLFGFIEDGGTEHLATAKTYATNTWTTETVNFDLNSETSGYISLGYTAVNNGSGNMPHLFVDGLTITYTSASNAYAATVASATATYNDATYANVTGDEKTALYNALNPASAPSTVAEYFSAVDAINAAVTTFTGAKKNYDQYAEAAAVATTLGATSVTAPTTATGALTRANELNVNIDTKVRETYTYDVTANYFSSWSKTEMDETSGQHWSGDSRNYMDAWKASGNSTATQTFSLPAGDYVLKVAGRGQANVTTVTMTADGQTVTFMSKDDTGKGIDNTGAANFADADNTYCNSNNGRGWEWRYIPLTLASAKDVTVTLSIVRTSGSWASFSDFAILMSSSDADSDDYAALNAAIAAAEAKTLGFEDGQYAPYNNVDALTKLADAKSIDQEATNVKGVVDGVTTALATANASGWTANSGDVDAIYNNDFNIASDGWNPDAWTSTGWAARVDNINETKSISDTGKGWRPNPGTITYGNTGVYTMPLADNQLYKLTFKYGAWDGSPAPTISVLNAENGLAATALAATSTNYKTAMVSQTMYFKTGAAGNYILSMAANVNIVYTDVHLVKADASELTISSGNVTNPTFFQELTLGGRTFSADKWNTLCVPFAFDKASFAEVKELSSITVNGENVSMAFEDASTIVAGKPYLVKAKNNDDALTATNVMVGATVQGSSATADGYTVNYVGTYDGVALTAANSDAWVVSANKLWNVNSDVTVGAYRAYFTVAASGGAVKALNFNFGTATGIETINGETVENGTIFNLAGQRVQKAQKGLYIVNGKKVLVK